MSKTKYHMSSYTHPTKLGTAYQIISTSSTETSVFIVVSYW